jgi:hypothetical protein
MASHLRHLPGLYLEANYRGGVSVRDRIARSQIVANQILDTLPKSILKDSDAMPVKTVESTA